MKQADFKMYGLLLGISEMPVDLRETGTLGPFRLNLVRDGWKIVHPRQSLFVVRSKPSILTSRVSVRCVRTASRQPDISNIPYEPCFLTQLNAWERKHNASVRKRMFQNVTIPTVYGGHRTK